MTTPIYLKVLKNRNFDLTQSVGLTFQCANADVIVFWQYGVTISVGTEDIPNNVFTSEAAGVAYHEAIAAGQIESYFSSNYPNETFFYDGLIDFDTRTNAAFSGKQPLSAMLTAVSALAVEPSTLVSIDENGDPAVMTYGAAGKEIMNCADMAALKDAIALEASEIEGLEEQVAALAASAMFDKTVTASGTTGNQTINKRAGSVNLAANATSLVVTNELVDENSVIVCTLGSNDANMRSAIAVAAAGSFTIYPDTAPDAEARVNFVVIA